MVSLKLVLVVVSLVLFTLAAVGVPTGRLSAVAAGLALWELSTIV